MGNSTMKAVSRWVAKVVAVAFVTGGATMLTTPTASAVPCASGGQAGWISVPDPLPLPGYTKFYRNCSSTGKKLLANYEHGNSIICVAPGANHRLGHWDGFEQGHPLDEPGEYWSAVDLGSCSNWRDSNPVPIDNIAGQAVVKRYADASAPLRGLPHARWELWCYCKGGKESDPVQWRPVLSRIGQNNEPDGPPLRGYLDKDGNFDDRRGPLDIEVIYPQNYTLADGTTWHGCVPADPRCPT